MCGKFPAPAVPVLLHTLVELCPDFIIKLGAGIHHISPSVIAEPVDFLDAA